MTKKETMKVTSGITAMVKKIARMPGAKQTYEAALQRYLKEIGPGIP